MTILTYCFWSIPNKLNIGIYLIFLDQSNGRICFVSIDHVSYILHSYNAGMIEKISFHLKLNQFVAL